MGEPARPVPFVNQDDLAAPGGEPPVGLVDSPVTAAPCPGLPACEGDPGGRVSVFHWSSLPATTGSPTSCRSVQDRRWRRAVVDHTAAAGPATGCSMSANRPGGASPWRWPAKTGADVVRDRTSTSRCCGAGGGQTPGGQGGRGRVRLAVAPRG